MDCLWNDDAIARQSDPRPKARAKGRGKACSVRWPSVSGQHSTRADVAVQRGQRSKVGTQGDGS